MFKVIRPQMEWRTIHCIRGHSCSCTCLATNSSSSEVVSGGEDGQINVLKLDHRHPVRTIGKDSVKTVAHYCSVKVWWCSYYVLVTHFFFHKIRFLRHSIRMYWCSLILVRVTNYPHIFQVSFLKVHYPRMLQCHFT